MTTSPRRPERPGGAVRIDCEAGRRLGCASFCCRLIVRLETDERDPGRPELADKRCIDKDPDDGLCVYFERDSGLCAVWPRRPRICREYDCNRDGLLQVVLRDGFRSLAELVRARPPPRLEWIAVPRVDETDAD